MTQAYTCSSGKTLKSGVAVYDDSFAWHETVLQGDGNDVITDYGNGNDTIKIVGLTEAQFNRYAMVSVAGDGHLTFHIGDSSIELPGVTDVSTVHFSFA